MKAEIQNKAVPSGVRGFGRPTAFYRSNLQKFAFLTANRKDKQALARISKDKQGY
jgi:hypothetical protein